MLPFWQSQGGQANWHYTNNRPVGLYEKLIEAKTDSFTPAGPETYVVGPENGSIVKCILLLVESTLVPLSFFPTPQYTELTPLVFGRTFPNVHLLADNYAKASFYTYVPNIHESDSLPIGFLQDVELPLPVREPLSAVRKTAKTAKVGATLGPWLINHREAVRKPLIDSFIREVRNIPSTDKVGTIGFC